MSNDLVQLFLRSISVDALSLKERPMADFVRSALSDLPLDLIEDDTASSFGGECGNIICVPRTCDVNKPTIALFAHLDTPRPTTNVRPVFRDNSIYSDGTTPLGVDNRAGTSVLLHVLREHALAGAAGQVIVVFTVGEELGLFGSKYISLPPYHTTMGFVFDCSKRPGTFIQSAVGCSLFDVTFRGKSAHAAVAPERGINAIQMASLALSRVTLGRLSPTMTCNVGMISGGSATNVIPDQCTIHGEVREFDPNRIRELLTTLEGTFRQTSSEMRGSVDFTTTVDFAPFRLRDDAPVVATTREILTEVGLTPHGIEYLGGSDANMLNGKGLPTVNLGIGAQNPHGNDEFILVEDLHKTADIVRALIRRSVSLQ